MEELKKEESMQNESKAEMPDALHYDAFISYRHTDLDKFVAENLHKQLEAYRMPADVAKKRPGMKNRIERVFRDKEELPLTSNLNDPIMMALRNSDWLIVICSPRLRESVWCKKEIESFIQQHGRNRVLAVLAEGEPAESFPDELLFKTEVVTKPDGSREEVKVPVEPLAADIRGKNKKEILKNMKAELLRILAAMFHMNFDDLRQRHKEQEHKRKMRYMALGIVVCFVVSLVSIGIALQMNHQNKVIQGLSDYTYMQNEMMKAEQAENLADKALTYLEKGDRESAIQYAVWASTQYESMTMPYTEEAQYALAECLGVYETGEIYEPRYQIETMGIITHMDVAQDKKTLIILDDCQTVTVYDTESREVILELGAGEHFIAKDTGYAFLSNNRLAYLNANNAVVIFNIETRAVEKELKDVNAIELIADSEGKYFAVQTLSAEYMVYNGETLECLGMTPDFTNGIDYSFMNSEGILAYSHYYNNSNESYQIHFLDCKTMQELSSLTMDTITLEDMAVDGDRAYVFASRYSDEPAENECIVYGIDITTGQVLWENSQKGSVGIIMTLPACENKKELLVLTKQTARLVDMQTGENGFQISLDSTPVEAFRTTTNNSFQFFCEDGTVIMLTSDMDYDVPMTQTFHCKTTDNKAYCLIANGIVTLPEQSNQITVYTAECADGVERIDAVEIAQPECYYQDTAQNYAREYGLEQPEYVKTLFFDPAKHYVFASYWNNDFIIYDVVLGRVVGTFEDCDTMCGYWGEDANQNMYIKGEKGGYIISVNTKIVMRIPYMKGLDLEQNKVYLQPFSALYEAPIYTSVELIQMAAPYMQEKEESAGNETPDSEG